MARTADQLIKYYAKTYGITPRQWRATFRGQQERCAICRTQEPGKRGWHTDHNHTNGKVRGILCGNCNVAIGFLGDDPERLRRAARYIEHARQMHGEDV